MTSHRQNIYILSTKRQEINISLNTRTIKVYVCSLFPRMNNHKINDLGNRTSCLFLFNVYFTHCHNEIILLK